MSTFTCWLIGTSIMLGGENVKQFDEKDLLIRSSEMYISIPAEKMFSFGVSTKHDGLSYVSVDKRVYYFNYAISSMKSEMRRCRKV